MDIEAIFSFVAERSNRLLSAETLSYNLNMRKYLYIIPIVLFSAIYYYTNVKQESSVVKTSVAKITSMIKNSTVASSDTGSPSETPPSKDSFAANPTQTELRSFSPHELRQWVQRQSASMNSTDNNTEEQQILLRAQAQTLLPEQLPVLSEIAINTKMPINERIFSAFLITMNSAPQAQEALFEGAKTEVPDFGPVNPHSEAELRHTQELAIRYMQIDELFERAKTNTNARDKLKLLITEAQSAQVRSYAEKRLRELK